MAPLEYLPALSMAPTAITENGVRGIQRVDGPNHLRWDSWNRRSPASPAATRAVAPPSPPPGARAPLAGGAVGDGVRGAANGDGRGAGRVHGVDHERRGGGAGGEAFPARIGRAARRGAVVGTAGAAGGPIPAPGLDEVALEADVNL